MITLYKSWSKNDINNSRPVPILPDLHKIFEKAISTRLVNYLESHYLSAEYQHGFRSKQSTETAIFQFINNVYQYFGKFYVAGILLDLTKAFDSFDHHILVDKLEYMGIRKHLISCLGIISHTSQTPHCNFLDSPSKLITKWVPEGSIFRPLLFIIYINDIMHCSSKFLFTVYTDGTNPLLGNTSINS